ncbi:MAG: DUF4230 domain-containing protein [Oscillospiraceae bacterium]|nr:DUF4230 domain-containing protein [Oscillospiraceae bacterium]
MTERKEITQDRQARREKHRRALTLAGWQLSLALIIAVVILAAIIVALKSENTVTVGTAGEASQLDGGLVYTEADIKDALLLKAREQAEFVVYEREVSVESTLRRSFADLEIFTKTKTMRSYGTGSYSVDLSEIDAESISVDIINSGVLVYIPHCSLYMAAPDYEKTEFEEIDRGLLAFGDIKLTLEQEKALEAQIYEEMLSALSSEACLAEADREALERCRELFSPLLSSVAPGFTVSVAFEE